MNDHKPSHESIPRLIGRCIGALIGNALIGASYVIGAVLALKVAIHLHWLG